MGSVDIRPGVVATTFATGPTARNSRFVSYEVRCSCGWKLSAEDPARVLEVREIGSQHGQVCVG